MAESPRKVGGDSLLLLLAIFVLDLLTPLGYAVWLLYLIPLSLTYRLPQQWAPIMVAAAATLLTGLGFFVSPSGVDSQIDIFNCTLGITVLWAMAMLLRLRKQAQVALGESEERFRNMADHSPAMVWVTDPAGACTYLNASWYAFTGQTPETGLGYGWLDAVHPEDRASAGEAFLAANARHEAFRLEYRLRHATGEYHWVIDAAAPRFGPGGRFLGYIGSVIDITERKQAEGSLKLFRALLDQANDAIEVIDPATGCFLDCNENACSSLGYTREELLSLTVPDIDPIVTLPIFTQYMTQFREVREGGAVTLETVHRRKDGSTFPVEVNCRLVRLDREYALAIVRDITDRKHAKEALRDSEANFRTLFEQAAVGVAQIETVTGQFAKVNRRYCEIVGYTAEEMQRLTFQEITHPEDLQSDLDNMARLHRGEIREFSMEKRYFRKDGAIVWVNLTVSAPWNFGGTSVFHTAVVQDITERKGTENALRESEQRFRQIVDTASEGIWQIDGESRTTFVNQRMADLLGYTVAEMNGASMFEFMDEEGKAIAAANVARRRSGIKEQHDFKFRSKDGSDLWAIVSADPIFDSAGRYAGALGLITDITDRKQAERALSESERRFRTLAASSPAGIFENDTTGRCLYVNERAAELVGLSVGECLDFGWTRALFEEDRDRIQERWQQAVGTRQPFLEEYRFRHADGTVTWVLGHVVAVTDTEGGHSGFIGTLTDITQRKEAEVLINGQKQVLEMIATGVPIAESLTALLRILEAQSPGMLCSILLLDADGVHLRHCATPSLPEEYCRAIDGVAIGPCVGSCGTAAFRREAVIVEDIATDPLWADYRGLALRHGLRACWSTPIFNAQRRVLGTFAMYYSRPARPTEHHLRLIEMATQIAAIAITNQREEEALQESQARLHLAVQATNLGPWDWDLRTNMVYFSPEWKRQIGYEEYEIPGRFEEWESRLHPEDREPTLAALRACLDRRRPEYDVEFRRRHKDGSYRWIYTRGEVMRDADGKPSRMLGCHLDITEGKRAVLAIKELARQQEAVADLGQQALAGMDLQGLMRAVVQVTARMLEVELCKVLELLPDGKALLLRAGVGWKEGFVGQASVSAGLNSQAGYTLASVHPVIVEDLRTETRFSGPPLLHDHGVISGMSVIIQGGHPPYGVLGAHTSRRRSFSADDINFLQAMANILSQAIQRKRAEDLLRQSAEQLRALNEHLQTVREEERVRIARELHDELGQMLTAMKMDLSWLVSRLGKVGKAQRPEQLIEKARSTIGLVDSSIVAVRRLVSELRPAVLDHLDLVAALQWQTDEFRQRTGLACEFACARKEISLDPRRSTVLFRIMQEALTNVARHAKASHARLAVEEDGAYLRVMVEDDGVGIAPVPTPGRRSFGLLGVRERVAQIGGTLSIQSAPGRGTTLTVWIPRKTTP